MASSVGTFRDDPSPSPWPGYGNDIPTIRQHHPAPLEFIRHIYFDQHLSEELLEHVGSTDSGRIMLGNLPSFARLADGNTRWQQDLRATLLEIIENAVDLENDGIIDLHQPSNGPRRRSWAELHPDQAIAIKGTVTSGKDIQPSSLRVDAGSAIVRVYVARDRFLHLNQSYLTGPRVTVVGKVRSVPRTEIVTAAIGTLAT